jgi:hypothetical protein
MRRREIGQKFPVVPKGYISFIFKIRECAKHGKLVGRYRQRQSRKGTNSMILSTYPLNIGYNDKYIRVKGEVNTYRIPWLTD